MAVEGLEFLEYAERESSSSQNRHRHRHRHTHRTTAIPSLLTYGGEGNDNQSA